MMILIEKWKVGRFIPLERRIWIDARLVALHVVHIEPPVAGRGWIREARVKGQPEQTALVVTRVHTHDGPRPVVGCGVRRARQIEERRRNHHPALNDVNLPQLVAHKQPPGSVIRADDVRRRVNLPQHHRLQRQRGKSSKRTRHHQCECQEKASWIRRTNH